MMLRRSSLPFVFLLSFIVIFLISHSTLRLPFPPSPSPHNHLLPPDPNPNPNLNPLSPTFSFTIKLLAFDRRDSLRRCLRSLADADYAGDRVSLHVYIDHFNEINSVNASVLVDRKLAEARAMLEVVDGFEWEHGEKHVHYRTRNVGLQAQWLEAWWPASDDEFVFVVEDDLEVSSLYYRFLKSLILEYYYDRSNYSPSIYGASLQRPRFVAGKHGNKLQLEAETHIFLYQLVGTWGQLLFPKPWKEFRLWYDEHKSKGLKPFLGGMVTTGWYKRMGERIWTPWFIKFIHSRGYYNIYTNFQHERALSVSHRDAGVNYGKSAGPDSTLLDKKSLDLNLLEMKPLKKMRWYDFCFREVLPERVAKRSDDLGSLLDSAQKNKTIIIVNLFRADERIVRNLLCQFERLNIRNHIFVGFSSALLSDLARRGQAVVYADKLIQFTDTDILREIMVKAHVIKKCLEHGYNAWMFGSDLFPLSDSLFRQMDSSYDFFATTEVELLLAQDSSYSRTIWTDDFVHKLTSAAKLFSDPDSGQSIPVLFSNLFADVLKGSKRIRIVRNLSPSHGVRLDSSMHTDVVSGKKLVFWSSNTDVGSLEEKLGKAGIWMIDEDLSCTSVVCSSS